MDWQVLIAPDASDRCLDGHVTDVHHERCPARENEDRRSRNQELLDPEAPESKEGWNATLMANHDALFPFIDNLTTLMFIVASDLSEAQSERLTSYLSLQGVEVTTKTFEAVRTVVVELFCTPKSSMWNPSLRVNKSGSHTQCHAVPLVFPLAPPKHMFPFVPTRVQV